VVVDQARRERTLFDPRISRGFQVPGTPNGLGEQQCVMLVDGTTSISEVVEYHEVDDTRRAVTRQVSPPPVPGERTVHEVHVAPGGSGHGHPPGGVGARWCGVARPYEATWHRAMADYFQRVRAVLALGAWSGAG